ncbi:hypothetical protein JW707_01230 [Candidatus Woesearchaeota archaeon]|nr:hypothetical protein [Candidatus Woesearchaeota archaeon]
MICDTAETDEKTSENIYSPRAYINQPVESNKGLSIRRAANLIHNSLMLIEKPEDINYNAASRLYNMLTKDFTARQVIELNWLLRVKYASEDAELAKRLYRLSKFKNREGIETREDLAADIIASIMYDVAVASAGKEEKSPELGKLAEKYVAMENGFDEEKRKKLNLDAVMHEEISNIVGVEMFGYKRHYNDFMDSYTAQKKETLKVISKDGNGDKKVTELKCGVEDFLNGQYNHGKTVVSGEAQGPLFDLGDGGIEGLLGNISALNPAD